MFFLVVGKKNNSCTCLLSPAEGAEQLRAQWDGAGWAQYQNLCGELCLQARVSFYVVARHCHFLNYFIAFCDFVLTLVTSRGVVAKCRRKYLLLWGANCCAAGQTITTLKVQIMYDVFVYKNTTHSDAILKKISLRDHIRSYMFFNICSKSW